MLKSISAKYSSLSRPARTALWFLICNMLLKGISFFSTPLFARLLPDEEYGQLTLFASYQQIVLIFATWEIFIGAYQKGIFKYKENI